MSSAIASFGISIGAIWEIIEWLTGAINSLNDTIIDLIMDTTGSTVAALVSLWALQERTRSKSTTEEQNALSAASINKRLPEAVNYFLKNKHALISHVILAKTGQKPTHSPP